ncbi:MAG: SPOR domain-containing protein [Candidatus Saccharimonadaceae bacterium]
MDEIALHIDFLLHTHDCVIVPGLGGFVVNVNSLERNGLWGIDTPTCELIFNSKLSYNDGLLAESLMKTNHTSFETAIKGINAACDMLKSKLTDNKSVVWANLGTFKMNSENEPMFLPNKSYIRPQFYGLTNARLKPSSYITSRNSENENLIPVKTFIQYISSGVAVALLFFFMVVSYNNFGPISQQAEIVSKSLIFNNNLTKIQVDKSKSSTTTSKYKENKVTAINTNTSSYTADSKEVFTTSSINYYIIVGVYEVNDVADKTLSTLKSQGFQNASIIKRPGRLDVYSAAFSNQIDAQAFLSKFKTDHPQYNDAWLLKH